MANIGDSLAMDHLPQLQNTVGVEVKLFEDARLPRYDERGLAGFPERCNFTFAEPDGLQMGREASQFFQTWLFFGTLVEIFKVYDIEVEQDDFVSRPGNGPATITTQYLQDYIAAWIVSASHEYPGCLDSSEHRSTARKVGNIAGSVAAQTVIPFMRAARGDETPTPSALAVLRNKRQLWGEGEENAKARAERIWAILDAAATALRNFGPLSRGIDAAVWDSVLVLCTTLQTAAFFIYRSIPLDAPVTFKVPYNTLSARISPQMFTDNGWCPREVKIISDLVEGDHGTLHLTAQLDRRHNLGHSNCNAGKCNAYQVNEEKYRTQHIEDCHGCDMLGFDGFDAQDPASNRLLEVIGRDQNRPPPPSRPTPMATYQEGKLCLVPVFIRQLLGPLFVAISHVWADGLGNPDWNALPRCQIERIQGLVNEQFPLEKRPVPFWMDTLCIPVSKDRPAVFRNAKTTAIKNMEGVYKSSTKILVLDRTLTNVRSQDMSPEEIGLRIMCSGWARRLWTLQEGLYQAQVHYQFADTTRTFKDLNEAVRQKHAFPTRSLKVPKTHFLQNYLANPPNSGADYEPLSCFAHLALSCCWPRISSFFEELDIKHSQPDPDWFPGMQLVPFMSVLVPRAMRTIAYRTTSRTEDEGLILGSLTNWRAGTSEHLIDLSGENRMRACFKQFAIVPSQLIFLDQKRFADTGERWIPKSLLAQSSNGTNPLPYEYAIISDEFSWPSSRGITAEYPSFRITLPPGWNSKGSQRVKVYLAGNRYNGFIHEAGSLNAPKSLPSSLALIVPRSIAVGPWKCVAAVISFSESLPSQQRDNSGFMTGLFSRGCNILQNYHDKSRMKGRHEALMDLERVPDGQRQEETLPRVDAVAMTEFLTAEKHIPWRIG